MQKNPRMSLRFSASATERMELAIDRDGKDYG